MRMGMSRKAAQRKIAQRRSRLLRQTLSRWLCCLAQSMASARRLPKRRLLGSRRPASTGELQLAVRRLQAMEVQRPES